MQINSLILKIFQKRDFFEPFLKIVNKKLTIPDNFWKRVQIWNFEQDFFKIPNFIEKQEQIFENLNNF